MRLTILAAAALAGLSLAAPLAAQTDEDTITAALKARQGFYNMLAANMGPLAGIARGDIAYDEAVARHAAENLQALGRYDVTMHFIDGTSRDDLGAERTAARPDIFANRDDFAAKLAGLREATAGAPDAVGDQRAVGALVGQIGGACKACHDSYRAN